MINVLFGVLVAVSVATPQHVAATKAELQALAVSIAESHNVSAELLSTIVTRESGWNPKAVGDEGTSFGLAQIHITAHPEVSVEEATDPTFALEWAADKLSHGFCRWWSTCPQRDVVN